MLSKVAFMCILGLNHAVITTNRKIESWFELFHDPVMANAAMDRIINKAYRIVLEGESYRKKFRHGSNPVYT